MGAASRHLLDGEASLEIERLLEFMERHGFGIEQRGNKGVVFLSVEGDVEVVALPFFVPRGPKNNRMIEGIGIDRGRDGVVEVEILFTQHALQIPGKFGCRERTCCQDDMGLIRNFGHDFTAKFDERVFLDGACDILRERDPVHRQGSACGNGGCIGRLDDERS